MIQKEPYTSIIQGDCLDIVKNFPDKTFSLLYTDPPFNTGNVQSLSGISYDDSYDDFLEFLGERLRAVIPKLKNDGSLFIHLDWHEVHYVKVMLDKLMGRDHFMGEIIWAYDYGGRAKKWWSRKHDNILWYVVDPKNYIFNYDNIDRVPYMAPDLVGPEKAARGKTPTDVWWNTIVPTQGKERVGYPTQKPLAIVNRIVKVHSNPGDMCVDLFAGSGTLGHSACINGRSATLIDKSPLAIDVMSKRLKEWMV